MRLYSLVYIILYEANALKTFTLKKSLNIYENSISKNETSAMLNST